MSDKPLGYSADFTEDYENGAWLTIRRGGDAVGKVAVALLPDGPDAQVGVAIERFRPNELLKVTVTDDLEPRETDREQSNRDTCGERVRPSKALFMTVWRPRTRSAEHSCGIRQG